MAEPHVVTALSKKRDAIGDTERTNALLLFDPSYEVVTRHGASQESALQRSRNAQRDSWLPPQALEPPTSRARVA